MAETWRRYLDWPYEVSDMGRVRQSPYEPVDLDVPPGCRLAPLTGGRILKQHLDDKGRLVVTLIRGHGEKRLEYVARIVARAFLRPPVWYFARNGTIMRQEVRHLDGDKTDCRAANLAWGTRSESRLVGLQPYPARGVWVWNAKLNDDIVREIRDSPLMDWELAREYDVDPRVIGRVRNYEIWGHVDPDKRGENMARVQVVRKRNRVALGRRNAPQSEQCPFAKLTNAIVRECRDSGLTNGELGLIHGVSTSAIRRARNHETWTRLDPENREADVIRARAVAAHLRNTPRGERHGCAKLTDDIVREIRRDSSVMQKEFARRLDVNRDTIRRIKNYEIWKHVDPENREADLIRAEANKRRNRVRNARGEANANVKLTEDDVLQIMPLRGVELGRKVARDFGVSNTTIRDIWSGRTWRQLFPPRVRTRPAAVPPVRVRVRLAA